MLLYVVVRQTEVYFPFCGYGLGGLGEMPEAPSQRRTEQHRTVTSAPSKHFGTQRKVNWGPSPYLSISAFVGKYRQIPADRFQTLVERNNRNEGCYSSRLMYRSDRYDITILGTLSPERHFNYPSTCTSDFNFILLKITFLIFLCVSAETEPHEGKRKVESLWPIFRLHHQRSRYIFDLFYKRKAISRGRQSFHSSYRTN